MLKMIKEAIVLFRRDRTEKPRSLHLRLFAFFALFASALIGAVFLILSITGLFNSAEKQHLAWLDTEQKHLQQSVSDDFNKLSLRGIAFARNIMADVGTWTERNGITEKEITLHPELMESLLAEEAGKLISALENNGCSGVFIILDDAARNDTMRSGLYFKRNTTNNVTALSPKLYCLRGPASVARSNKIELLGQWRSKFDVSGMSFYRKVLDTARQNNELDVLRLYYWSERYQMEEDSEQALRLCIPLIARDGTVYGICGMEISAMMFKNLYTPNDAEYLRVFAALAARKDNVLNTEKGLLAGNSYLTSQTIGLLTAENHGEDNALRTMLWNKDDTVSYFGKMSSISLYPADSPFADEEWALALLIPLEDWERVTRQSNFLFYGIFAALLAFGLFSAVFISRRYIRPVVSALELMKTDDRKSLSKTHITEIDDLLEYLTALDEARKTLDEEKEILNVELDETKHLGPVSAAYEQFLRNLETLTASERAVFNLYMKDLSAQQIAGALFVSINTIKFHNRNIYAKLGISSLKELKIYVNMMKEMEARR
jgi:DNA-binding CsgD family transcriptional regulator